MADKHVNENVPVIVMGTAIKAVYGATESKQIQNAVRDRLLLASMEPYHKVQVVVKHKASGKPEAIIAYMLRAHTYTADIARLDVDEQYSVRSVERSYVPEGGEVEYAITVPKKPLPCPDMVFGTPVPEIATAKAAVEYAYKLGTSLGYKCVKLLGPAASVANYSHYLGTCHLKAFGNVGHGWTGGIVLADGNLEAPWFDSRPKNTLCPEVIYFNSCQTFNPPLQPAIMKAGARTFVGGRVNLLIGPSENVFKCFWTESLKNKQKMGPALTGCEKKNYPTPGSHGISGDLGTFLPIPKCLRGKE